MEEREIIWKKKWLGKYKPGTPPQAGQKEPEAWGGRSKRKGVSAALPRQGDKESPECCNGAIGAIAGPFSSLNCSSHIFHELLYWWFPKIPPNCPISPKNKTLVSGITCVVWFNYKFLYMTASLCFVYCSEEPMKEVVCVQYCYHSDKLTYRPNFAFCLPSFFCLWLNMLFG